MLKISKKADYALMALQYMATVQYGEMNTLSSFRVVNTKEIAEEHHIPLELLAKVLQTLAKHEMIESQNGPWLVSHGAFPLPRFWKRSRGR
jgi:DNA-binding IscR family transcriptional regulator